MSKQLEQEILKIKRQIERTTSKELLPLLQAYKRSLEQLQGKSAQLINKHIDDGVLHLADAQRHVILHELEQDIINESNSIGTLELGIATGILSASYSTGYNRTFYELERGINLGVSFNLLRPEFIHQAIHMPLNGADFSDRIWHNKEGMIRRLRGTLQRTIINGADPKKMVKGMSDAFGSSAYESSRLIQTEVARATTKASEQVYRDSGVVQQVQWIATLDEDTDSECEELDGMRWDLDDTSRPDCPIHPNCRCVIVGVPFEEWNPKVKKDNQSKEIIDYQNYSEWAKDKGIN